MADQLNFRLPEVLNDVDPRQHIVTLLRKAGLNSSDAQQLVDDELEITSVTGLKTLTKLLEGQYSESREWIEASAVSKLAGAKFIAFLQWDGITGNAPEPLTSEEKELVLVKSLAVSVKTGFFDRLATYAKKEQQLLAVLKVFQPTVISTGIKNEGPDGKREKTHRLIAAAADILGAKAEFTDEQ